MMLLNIGKLYGISNKNWHLFIMNGHNYITLDVAHIAIKIGLDVLTIPNHTSHAT